MTTQTDSVTAPAINKPIVALRQQFTATGDDAFDAILIAQEFIEGHRMCATCMQPVRKAMIVLLKHVLQYTSDDPETQQ